MISVNRRLAGFSLAPKFRTFSPQGAASLVFLLLLTYAVPASAQSGLVAAYGFDEGAGTTTADASGNANTGTLSGATWNAAGRYGGALTFDGVNDWVTVPDKAVLDLTSAMTLEAWVYASAVGSWRTVLLKEGSSGLSYCLVFVECQSAVRRGGSDARATSTQRQRRPLPRTRGFIWRRRTTARR